MRAHKTVVFAQKRKKKKKDLKLMSENEVLDPNVRKTRPWNERARKKKKVMETLRLITCAAAKRSIFLFSSFPLLS